MLAEPCLGLYELRTVRAFLDVSGLECLGFRICADGLDYRCDDEADEGRQQYCDKEESNARAPLRRGICPNQNGKNKPDDKDHGLSPVF